MTHALSICIVLFLVWPTPLAFAADDADPGRPILNSVVRAERKAEQLAAKLEQCRSRGGNIAYPDAALAVAQLFCRFPAMMRASQVFGRQPDGQ